MRIGVDTRDLQIARTGARTYLAEILSAFERVAAPHVIVPLTPKNAETARSGSTIGKIREHVAYTWWKQVELPRLAKANCCDVIFCTDYTVPLISHAKTIPVFHDGNFWVTPEHYNRLWRVLMDVFAVPGAKRSPAVVTVSEFSRQEIAAHTGIVLEKIIVIPNAPKTSTATSLPAADLLQVLARYDLADRVPYILHVGVLEKRKNLVRLVEAFALFKERVQVPYRLVLVGQPGPRQAMDDSINIQAAIRRLGLADYVRLIGYVSDTDLPALYQGAAMFVFPSLREGFGIPILEAYNSRLPVAAANSSAIPEVAGGAALLFDPNNTNEMAESMAKLAQDASLRSTLIEQGLKRMSCYSWDRTARELISLFERTVEHRT